MPWLPQWLISPKCPALLAELSDPSAYVPGRNTWGVYILTDNNYLTPFAVQHRCSVKWRSCIEDSYQTNCWHFCEALDTFNWAQTHQPVCQEHLSISTVVADVVTKFDIRLIVSTEQFLCWGALQVTLLQTPYIIYSLRERQTDRHTDRQRSDKKSEWVKERQRQTSRQIEWNRGIVNLKC